MQPQDSQRPPAAPRRQWTAAEMESRIARFNDLKPTRQPFVDSQIAGALREAFLVIGNGVVEQQAVKPAIADAESFNVTIIRAPQANGASLHSHDTAEVFVAMTGECSVFWLDGDEERSIRLQPFDLISIPIGVMRGFRNESAEESWLFAITDGADSGRVHWHPEVLTECARHGWVLDAKGDVRQVEPGAATPTLDLGDATAYAQAAPRWSAERMEKERVARFDGIRPSDRPFLDTVIPGHERQNFNVLGRGVTEDPSLAPSIADVPGFNITDMMSETDKGPALHDHGTVEVFFSLQGEWEIAWGDEGENTVRLGTFDTISVPAGVMRSIRNVGGGRQWLMTVLGENNPGRVRWHDKVIAAAAERGLGLDAGGNLIELAR